MSNKNYYQFLHEVNNGYKENNWLVNDINEIRRAGGRSLLEVGCGNGRFLELAAKEWDRVYGIDWARSPILDKILENNEKIDFARSDINDWTFDDQYDVIISADVLEHLKEDDLRPLIKKMLRSGRVNYHKIACFDDGHSHLSIFSPERWLDIFQSVEGGSEIRLKEEITGDMEGVKVKAILTNL